MPAPEAPPATDLTIAQERCDTQPSVSSAADNYIGRMVGEARLPSSTVAVLAGTVDVDGTQYHRFALQFADSVEVRGAGLVVSVNGTCEVRLTALNIDRLPATLPVDRNASSQTRQMAASIGTDGDHLSWHGSAVEVDSSEPLIVDRWVADDLAFVVNRANGLMARQGTVSGHGAYLAADEHNLVRPLPRASTPGRDSAPRTSPVGTETRVTGSGLAYRTDPRAGEPELLPLPGLLGDGLHLSGEYVSVSSRRFDTAGEPTPSSGPSGEFVYEPVSSIDANCVLYVDDCSLIDNVNAYHHIDRFARDFWISRLGVDINFATTVWTHTSQTGSIVHGDTIRLGSGGLFLNNNALEDDILYHEYTHVALRHLGFVPDVFSTTQHRALGEGYSDYFALTFLDRPRFADWATRCPPRLECEGPEDSQEIRTLATDPSEWSWNYGVPSVQLKYGVCTRKHLEDLKCKTSWMTFDETYVWGMIWGSTLWDIREALGPDAADELVVTSLALTGGQLPTFTAASGAIVLADERVNGGANAPTLRAIFAARGITPFLSAGTSRENADGSRVDLELDVWPNPVQSTLRVTVRGAIQSSAGDVGHVSVFDASGRAVARVPIAVVPGQPSPVDLDLNAFAAGTYFVVAQVGNNSATRTVTRIR